MSTWLSVKSVHRSSVQEPIENEKERQIDLIESGEKVIQETRRWDDTKEYSYAMRSKEDAQDYRYFPDPDLVPVMISDEWMEEIRSRQPELRDEKRIRYKEEYDIPDYDIDILTNSKKLADIFEEAIALGAAPKKVSNWLMVETMRLMKEASIDADDLKWYGCKGSVREGICRGYRSGSLCRGTRPEDCQ